MSTGAALVPSAQRAVPLKMRADLTCVRMEYQQSPSWVVKDPVALRYFRFQPEQYKILELLNGERSLEQVRDEFHKEFPSANLTLEEIQSLISDMHQSGLVVTNRFGQGTSLLKTARENFKKKVWQTLQNILYLRLPGWDPERTLNFLQPYFQWMFTWWGFAFWALMALSALSLVSIQFQEFQSRLPEFQQFFGWPNLMYMWLILGGAKIIHEFGHGLSCKHYGGECHEMGVMLLVLSPALYCDVTDSWLLKNKWQRIIIGAAGMYIEVLLSSFAVWIWWFTKPGLLNYLCLNLFFVSTVSTVIFNANPLMRYDGYYMLSDWLEIPNLRPKADKMLREAFAWYCLGIESRPDPFMPQTGKGWFIAFAIAAAIYRWVILFGILMFFYTFLKPYELQSIGIALAVISVVSIVSSLVVNVYKIISAPRREPMDKFKMSVSLATLAVVLGAGLFIPFPWSLEEALVVEPENVRHVYVVTPGLLEEVLVKPGDEVEEGAVLARLSNWEKQQEYQRLQKDAKVQEVEITTQRALQDFARERLAVERLQTIREQLADYEDQLRQLTIVAPAKGKVVAAPRVPEPKLDKAATKLPRWHGSPLDPRNALSHLDPGTHVLSIAPTPRYEAILVIDQADRNDLALGQEVRIKLDDLPDQTYKGRIAQLSDRHLEYAPTPLTNKAGGDLATVTDGKGRERLQSIAYQATVLLEEDTDLLRAGFRGRAKFTVAHRSASDWIMRYLRRTFHFRL